MAITSEIIGKLGGAEVQKIPVNIVANGAKDSEVVMHTAHVPEGETWLVGLSGNLNPASTSIGGPQLFIGEVSIGPYLRAGRTGLAAEVTGTAKITLKRNTPSGSDAFTGHVYTVKM